MTRRQLGTIALGAAAMPQVVSKAESVYDPTLDPVDWTKQRHDSAPLRMTFNAADRKQAEAWQKGLRAKLVELLGGFPNSGAAPVAEVVESRDYPAYRRQRFLFQSRPGVKVAGYLLTPKSGKAPYATVVCVPGHGRGADDIVGIDENARDRTDKPGYQHDFAIQVAEQGMAAVAIEPMAFGCRRDPISTKKGQTTSACQPAAGAALLLGETMIGWRVYDVMRTIDWIGTRPELDVHRVGCMGISGGGTCTLFSAALDTRIKAAMVSCYLNTFRDSIISLSHCIDNYVPGILNWAEMYDVGGLVAPRALFSEAGLQDPIFPIDGSRASFAKLKRVYEVFGAADRTEQHTFEGKHEFNGSRGIPFLARQLKA